METLLGKTLEELTLVAQAAGLPAFAGKQMAEWLYRRQAESQEEMTNLSKKARETLARHYTVGRTPPVDVQRSVDGTAKYLFRASQGGFVETVYIPDGERATLCVSC